MTDVDKKMTELIAEHVMKLTPPTHCSDDIFSVRELWHSSDGEDVIPTLPNIFEDEVACMMAWDKFSFDRPTELERVPLGWQARVRRGDAQWIFNKDRKRAMVECMAKAIEEGL